MLADARLIPLPSLVVAFIPVVIAIGILIRWSMKSGVAIYAVGRMVIQLLLIGFVLMWIFETEQSPVPVPQSVLVIAVLSVMLAVASWIALRPIADRRRDYYWKALIAILLGGGSTLILMTQAVLRADPWFSPAIMIPLAGMIFSNCMNTISLGAERLTSEMNNGVSYADARRTALQAALIPITNSLLAVGLVSLPGMMTGQILSGVSPLIAVRYQIMVMCMAFGSGGISTAVFLMLVRPKESIEVTPSVE